jgi:NAD(P)-dependent dehydrogenase (short-subunit alcohol dehydrogenase family)
MERIAVVTGASRGAGKGIALALGAAGATVYVTGRSTAAGDSRYGGTVAETAQLITDAGGLGIAVAVDHADDQAVCPILSTIGQLWLPTAEEFAFSKRKSTAALLWQVKR